MLGDFNVGLKLEDMSVGSSNFDIAMREFNECVEEIEVSDVARSGLQFTWNQKPHGANGILKKLNHVMANLEFHFDFPGAFVSFRPSGISDHAPVVLWIPVVLSHIPRPFKFANVPASLPRFKEVMTEGVELKKAQLELDSNPSNFSLCEKEAEYVCLFTDALLMEERFLKQKSKVKCLKVGDLNSSYFHKSVKGRVSRHRIDVVTTLDGDLVTDVGVPTAFVSYYKSFLGQSGYTIPLHAHDLVLNILHPEVALDMVNPVTAQEVKEAIFSMGNDKSPGPDGYTACFFKESWDIMASDVILILMHNYHLDRSSPRCTFKVDIQKAYETMDWGFLKEGKRGLRQGDPLSPYLFTIIMEVLTLILQRRVRMSDDFLYHWYCSNLELINLCFADDLFLFAHGDSSLARVIMEALDEFKNSSGLTPSLPKSMAYFCNYLNHMKMFILQILSFDEGRLLVKYLGVPLVTSRLVSMHVYWALVFILPTRILLDIEQLVRGFFWCHGDMRRGKAKVLWEAVCLPKKEGGLGLRRLEFFNKALMVSHIWNLLVRKESLWAKWIHEYKLRGWPFFEIPCRATCSLWFDKWSPIAPLADVVTSRDIHRAGFGLSYKVKDAIFNGGWSWPSEWYSKYPIFYSFSVPNISSLADVLEWRNNMDDGPPDLHERLFFECSFSTQVWGHMRNLAGLSNEWNSRLLNNQKHSFCQVIECIKSSVRLKLLSCYFKKSRDALFFKQLWELPDSIHRNA
ncbi:RNA-directed DNA polymerase, eukaryota, reverse transcriptase zinc-binding domain protein [Tanacetum coccineum]